MNSSTSLGLKWIPAYSVKIDTDSEMMEYALIENIQRQDLDPIEIGISYQKLIDELGLTQEKLSEKIGKKRSLGKCDVLIRFVEMCLRRIKVINVAPSPTKGFSTSDLI